MVNFLFPDSTLDLECLKTAELLNIMCTVLKLFLFYFIFYLFNVGNKNIQLRGYWSKGFSIKRKC